MPNEDPPRLKHSREAPPELVRALEALHKGVDDRARINRVGAKLLPTLEAEAPQPTAASGFAGLVVKLCLGVLVLAAPAVWWMQRTPAPKPAGPAIQTTPVISPAPVVPEPAAIAQDNAQPEPPALETTPNNTRGARGRSPGASSRAGKRGAESAPESGNRSASRSGGRNTLDPSSATAQPAPAAPEAANERAAASPAEPASAEERPAAETRVAATPAPQPTAAKLQPSDARAQTPAVASEARLLFDARVALRSDPASALRSLQVHEQRYPHGRLIPERELLTIEALRALGRKDEAKTRADQFRARYPDSFHLKRLRP